MPNKKKSSWPCGQDLGHTLSTIAEKLRTDLRLYQWGESVLEIINSTHIYAIDLDEDTKLRLVPTSLRMRYLLIVNGLGGGIMKSVMDDTFGVTHPMYNALLKENNFLDSDKPVDQLVFLLKMA